ncbi:MAG: type II toxin-antitoxin system VapC family toxin [Acidobacteriaceae bacterium]
MNAYVDTSFLVSLYSSDANSAAAVQAMRAARGVLLLTTFAELEVVNALELRVFRKEVSPAQAHSSLNDFEQDLRSGIFQLKPLPDNVFGRARQLSRRTTPRLGTRTADLLHVAAALELGSDWFYSFDGQQRKLAQAVKLKVNPLP